MRKSKIFLLIILSVLSVILISVGVGCSCSSDTELRISAMEISIKIGEEYTLTANEEAEWETSDESIATVSSDGTVKGINSGVCTITATAGKNSVKCTVKVLDGVSEIVLSSTKLDLEIGQTHTLSIENAEIVGTVVWTTLDESVATVSNTGEVKAVGEGTTQIRANKGQTVAICDVTVVLGGQDRVTLSCVNANLYDGEQLQIQASLSSGGVVEWSVENSNVVLSVDGNTATIQKGTGYGLCTITATYKGSSAVCTVYVLKNTAQKLEEPSLLFTGKHVEWQQVQGAVGYRVKIDFGKWNEVDDATTSYDLPKLETSKSCNVYVQAISQKDGDHLDSDVSDITAYGELTTFVQNEKVVFYGAENAISYSVMLNDQEIGTINNNDSVVYSYSIYEYRNSMNGFNDKIKVRANFEGGINISGNTIEYGYLGIKTVVDDFESGMENVPTWESVTNKFIVSHSDEVSRSGEHSIKVQAKSSGGVKGGTLYIKLPSDLATDKEHTVSMWVYVESIKKNGQDMNWSDVIFSAAAYTERCMYKVRRLSSGFVSIGEWTKISFRVSKDEGEIFVAPDGNKFLVLYQNADYWYNSAGKQDETEGVKTITYYIDDVSICQDQLELVSVGYNKQTIESMLSTYDTTDPNHVGSWYVSSQVVKDDSNIASISVGKNITLSSGAGRNAVDGGQVKDKNGNAYTTKLYSVLNVFVDSGWWGADHLRFKPLLQPRYANAGNGTSNTEFLSSAVIEFWVKSDTVEDLVFVVDKGDGNGFVVLEENVFAVSNEWQKIVFDCSSLGYQISQLVIASTSGNADGNTILSLDGLKVGIK